MHIDFKIVISFCVRIEKWQPFKGLSHFINLKTKLQENELFKEAEGIMYGAGTAN